MCSSSFSPTYYSVFTFVYLAVFDDINNVSARIKSLSRAQDSFFKKLNSMPTSILPIAASNTVQNCDDNVTSLHSAVSKLQCTLSKAVNDNIKVMTQLDKNLDNAYSSIESFGDLTDGPLSQLSSMIKDMSICLRYLLLTTIVVMYVLSRLRDNRIFENVRFFLSYLHMLIMFLPIELFICKELGKIMTSILVPSMITLNILGIFNNSILPINFQYPSVNDINANLVMPPHGSGLRIYFQNINGMRSKLMDFKVAVLEGDCDVIAIVETWLYPDILDCEFFDESVYNVYRLDRCVLKHQRGGGILIAIKSHFTTSLLPLLFPDNVD